MSRRDAMHRQNLIRATDPESWLMLLMRARNTGNSTLEARAMMELERLGISVTYHGDRTSADLGVQDRLPLHLDRR